MKTRALRTALGSLTCLALLAVFSGDNARVSAGPTLPLKRWSSPASD